MYPSLCIVDDDLIFITTVELIYSKVLKSPKELIKFTQPELALAQLTNETWLNDHAPLIVFCDINMPGMHGFELIEQLRAQYNGENDLKDYLKIYMLTSSISANDKKRASEDPYITDFISKPLSPDKLKNLLVY